MPTTDFLLTFLFGMIIGMGFTFVIILMKKEMLAGLISRELAREFWKSRAGQKEKNEDEKHDAKERP